MMRPARRMWVIGCALAALLTAGVIWPAWGDDDSGEESALNSQPLPALTAGDLAVLKQLESTDWHQRKAGAAAAANLRASPDDTELVLRAMLARTSSPEAQARIDAVLKQLSESHLGGATPITLHLHNVPAREACEKLFAQAHWKIVTEPDNLLDDPKLPRVTIDADSKPFWDVMYQLSEQTRLGLSRLGRPELTLIGNEPVPNGPYSNAGPIRFYPTYLEHNEVLGLDPVRSDGDDFYFEILAYEEPKLTILGVDPYVEVQEAVDDHGNSLVYDDVKPPLHGLRGPPWTLRALLVFPPVNPGTKIAKFRALAHVRVGVDSQHVEIDDPLHAAPRTLMVGKAKIQFLGCKLEDNQYVVSFSSPVNEKDPQWGQAMQQMLLLGHLRDEKGRSLIKGQFGIRSYQPVREEYFKCKAGKSLNGVAAGPPVKLEWSLCPTTRVLSIPIEFHDLDMNVFPH